MYKLLTYQVLAHISLIYAIIFFNPLMLLVSFITYYGIMLFGINPGYHRLVSHRGFVSPRWFKIVSLFIGTLGLNASALVWGAMHREHHAYSDTEQDPHSPSFQNMIKTYYGVISYRPKMKFAKDLLRDNIVMFFHKNYFTINIVYDIILFLINPEFVVYLHLLPAVLVWHATAATNYFTHLPWFGYRNYETDDKSRNSHILAFLIAGEGYHNNHHADPKNTDFGHKKNEFDLTGWLISKIREDKK